MKDDLEMNTSKNSFSRRDLIRGAGALAAAPMISAEGGLSLPFLDLQTAPSSVKLFAGIENPRELERHASEWTSGDVVVSLRSTQGRTAISLASPSLAPTHVRIRWQVALPEKMLVLGDAWERSYGDLGWRNVVPERSLPWYCAISLGATTHCYGVQTGAGSLAFWQVDTAGITLWLDVRNGGSGVELGNRTLEAATLVARRGESGESSQKAIAAFCRTMCPRPRLPDTIVYGSNDWYYAYGKNTPEGILRDADLVTSLAPKRGPKPFAIVDDGWQSKATFPDMARLTEEIRSRGARPGLWIRPLQAHPGVNPALLLPDVRYGKRGDGLAYDPTIPEAREIVLNKMTEAVGWGNDLVKHDFSTYELLGQWGSQMEASPTLKGWHLNDRSRTNAEVILDLYRGLREAAGQKTILIGCNTVGHLSAGIFEASRTGDDVSGRAWERTRRMGVNTLAFRLPQNRTFFIVDADCVPVTQAVPWKKTKMWLDLVARSGTALIVSAAPDAVGPEQREALREAFAIAASTNDSAIAEDEKLTNTPRHWTFQQAGHADHRDYYWEDEGASPFPI